MNRRLPWLTLAVFVVTSVVTAAMYARPEWGIGTALMRDPLMLAGQWWRFATAWLVNVDGWPQILVNSAGLLLFGSVAELRAGRRWWLAGYVVAGLAGEVAGIFWQPLGGGNSVAVCGLIGLFSATQLAQKDLPLLARYLSGLVWTGLGLWLLAVRDIHGAALVAGHAVGAAWWLAQRRRR